MKEHLAIRQGANVLAVFSLVGDEHDGRMRSALEMLEGVRQFAETLGKLHLLHVIKLLMTE